MDIENTQETNKDSFVISVPLEEQEDTNSEEITYNAFEWILDDDLLRDEGVYFGLTNSPSVEKTKVIEKFFEQQIEAVEAEISIEDEKKSELSKEKESLSKKLKEYDTTIEKLSLHSDIKSHNFYRSTFGFIFFLSILIANFFLIYDWLKPEWSYPLLTALGLYGFGMLSMFNLQGVLFTHEEVNFGKPLSREKWKVYAEEFIVPLIVTSFVLVWGREDASISETITIGLTVLVLFLLCGKSFLSVIPVMIENFKIYKNNRKQIKFDKKELKRILVKKAEAERREEDLKLQIDYSKESVGEKKGRVKALNALCQTKISLFMSEYNLSEAAIDSLNDQQIANLLTEKAETV